MTIGRLIATSRRQKGLSQRALAKLLGLSPSAVAQWEVDDTTPDPENMAAIKMVLEIRQSLPVSETAPYGGELVEDPDELALLRFWRGLSPVKRQVMFEMLRVGDKPTRIAV